MTAIAIDPMRLKTIRKARKIGRPKLGKFAGLSERQMARVEGGAAGLSVAQLEIVADVLQVPAPVLTGDLPMAEDDLAPAERCTKGCCG